MSYAFIKRYNPAYDVFLIKYFKEAGFVFDDKLSFEELRPGWVLGSRRNNLSPEEKLFCNYMSDWRFHPEVRPVYYELFEKAIGSNGAVDVKKLRELESQLAHHQGRLVFSSQEAAKVIAEFYRNFMKNPLGKEMEKGEVDKQLTKFFSRKEIEALPYVRDVGEEKMEEKRNRIAGKHYSGSSAITMEKVDWDIRRVLDEHERMGEHMKLSAHNPLYEGGYMDMQIYLRIR